MDAKPSRHLVLEIALEEAEALLRETRRERPWAAATLAAELEAEIEALRQRRRQAMDGDGEKRV